MAKRRMTSEQQRRAMRERRSKMKSAKGSQQAARGSRGQVTGLAPAFERKVAKIAKKNLEGKQTPAGAKAFARKNKKRGRR